MKSYVSSAVGLLITALLLWGCTTGPSPKGAFQDFTKAVKEGKWETVWDSLSSKTQKAFEDEGYKKMKELIAAMPADLKKEKVAELGVTNEQLLKMSAKDFFVLIMKKTNAPKEFLKDSGNDEVERIQVKDKKAKLKIKGKNEVATMVLEGPTWKIEFEDE